MKAINVLLALLVSLLIALLVFEGGLRLFPAFRPSTSVNEFDAELGWSKKANTNVSRSTGEFSIDFDINASGLRDDDVTYEPAEGMFRVLCLGDSFTLGYTVDREHLFVDHLERYWGSQQRRVDVVNAGTEGYSTDQAVRWFQTEGKKYKPDVVLLFPYENDIYWNGQERYQRYPKPRFDVNGDLETGTLEDPGPKGWQSSFALGNFLAKVVRPLVAKQDPSLGKFQPTGTDVWVMNEFAPLFKNEPDFVADCKARTIGALKALKADCDDVGAKLIVAPIPSESCIDDEEKERFRKLGVAGLPDDHWSPDRPVDFFLSAAASLDLATIDARPQLKEAQKAGDKLYFQEEWHFTPAGNEAFARVLVDRLDEEAIFPESHKAMPNTDPTFDVADAKGGIPFWLKLYGGLWAVLGTCFVLTYPKDNKLVSFFGVGVMLALVFGIFMGVTKLMELAGPNGPYLLLIFAAVILGFVIYKLGRRIGTIMELLQAFTLRGHWYLMPLVVVLLSIGSLLVVAASSPMIAPFIYTLF